MPTIRQNDTRSRIDRWRGKSRDQHLRTAKRDIRGEVVMVLALLMCIFAIRDKIFSRRGP